MKNSVFLLAASVATLLACDKPAKDAAPASSAATELPHWDYGQEGPAVWGSLSPAFAACSSGQSQSPVDIVGATRTSLPALASGYRPATLRIVHHEHKADVVNTGHSIQVNYASADTLTVGDMAFPLVQYHFHSPSEHTVGGKSYPMEMHFVHRTGDGHLAVVGVLIEEGTANAAFDPIWTNLPATKGVETHLESVQVDVDRLLPRNTTTYRYDGSLTTPPCSESVKWFVMTTPIQLSPEQIGRFRGLLQGNNRPVQPLNGRVVQTDQF